MRPRRSLELILIAVLCAACATQPQSAPRTAKEWAIVSTYELIGLTNLATQLVSSGALHSNDAEDLADRLEEATKWKRALQTGVDEHGDPITAQDAARRYVIAAQIALSIIARYAPDQ